MHTVITSRNFELTEPIKDYISHLAVGLEKYNLDILSCRVVASSQKKGKEKKKKIFLVNITLSIAKMNTVVISQKEKDLYVGVDLAFSRMNKILRRYHDRIVHKHIIPGEELVAANILRDEEMASRDEDEIVPMDLDLHKPLDIEDALEHLKSSSQQFFIFNDKDSKMRVIYKRSDGKYGLY
ncbi:MAG: ribosome-associated translation inhibitor RaiA [Helicobacter sp.]|nr:ribosome-associated translation inhibitor RaiA [Helicobacter sp.]